MNCNSISFIANHVLIGVLIVCFSYLLIKWFNLILRLCRAKLSSSKLKSDHESVMQDDDDKNDFKRNYVELEVYEEEPLDLDDDKNDFDVSGKPEDQSSQHVFYSFKACGASELANI